MADFDRAQHQARATNLGLSMGRGRPRFGAQRAPARPLLRDPPRLFHRSILKKLSYFIGLRSSSIVKQPFTSHLSLFVIMRA